jgi:hypothetical protein
MQKVLKVSDALQQLRDAGYTVGRSQFYMMIGKGYIPAVRIPGSRRIYVPLNSLETLARPISN